MQHKRNFSIIAHIDHGKSTLADRMIEMCGGLDAREMSEQVLDSMDIEKERGITIKAQTVSLSYTAVDGITYQMNLIDTPGHVDFAYEVSRSLAACEGALLVVDASQGVEAQTVANCYTAVELGLEVLPVLNKIDLPSADPERVCQQIEDVICIPTDHVVSISAKTGMGINAVFEQIIKYIPPPAGNINAPLKALIIDAWFDNYVGVVLLIRVFDGQITPNQKIRLMSNEQIFTCEKVGVFTPKTLHKTTLNAGDVGFVISGIKDLKYAKVGDTVTSYENPTPQALSGFKEAQPNVFAGLYPTESSAYEQLREALNKLKLNDAALQFEPETSTALCAGFRCGFLGLLHMDVVKERLEREFDLDLIVTAPTVVYQILQKNGQLLHIENPAHLPDQSTITEMREPTIRAKILVPQDYLGSVITLCNERRGEGLDMQYLNNQVILQCTLPMNEVIFDFFDTLKSISRGYASFDYEFKEFVTSNLAKVDILLNGEKVDALSVIAHRSNAASRARILTERLSQLIPRQMFDIAIQATIGGQIIARATVKALRKNVLAKCYGGDITRKKKLLEKQKAGKKRRKLIGKVEVSKEAFLALLQK